MLNIKVKVLEGRNIYGKDNCIYLSGNKNIDKSEILKIIQIYKRIEEKLNLNSYIGLIKENNCTEVFIKNENLYLCSSIIKSIINNLSEEDIIDKVKKSIDEDWSSQIRKLASNKNISYIKENEDEVILGYGENSFNITKDDYINKYNANCFEIFKEVERKIGDMPIISVTGTNGKTTTVRLIHRILLDLGYSSGLASTGGIYIGDKSIKYGDTTGFYSAREVLKNKEVNVAVLETARGGILKKGLGYKNAKVAIITSLSEDHIGLENIKSIDDLLNIKSMVAEELSKDGVLVIKSIPILVERFKDRNNVILFNDCEDELIQQHVKKGRIAYYVKENYIVKNDYGVEAKIISIKEIPFAFYGISKSNIRNAMVAIIAVQHICKDINRVINSVKKIECNIYTNLGRQNIIEFNNFKMIIDYGHNSEAFKEVFSIAESMSHKKIIGVITAAGDREDAYIKELGEISSRFCDEIIIKEQPDLRGRGKGETARLLAEGVLHNKYDDKNIKVILEEEDAILEALRSAKDGDIIVSFSQFLYITFPAINKFRKEIGLRSVGEDLELIH